jgi:hypothetical protein
MTSIDARWSLTRRPLWQRILEHAQRLVWMSDALASIVALFARL